MAKQEAITNLYESGTPDAYDRKYLRYFIQDFNDRISLSAFDALKTKDISVIERNLTDLANTTTNFTLLIGLICLIIERERLYEDSEFGVSYLRYADHLFDDLNIPMATMSEGKIAIEQYLEHHKQLTRAGFKLYRNATKLRYLPEALENHQEEEVYSRIVNDTFRGFRDWAQRKNIARRVMPEPEKRVDVRIDGGKLYVGGKNLLNFPRGVPEKIKEYISQDLAKTLAIREGGNEPLIIETYGRGEQTAIGNFLKKFRAKK